jgi:hypothetical protein
VGITRNMDKKYRKQVSKYIFHWTVRRTDESVLQQFVNLTLNLRLEYLWDAILTQSLRSESIINGDIMFNVRTETWCFGKAFCDFIQNFL